MKSKKTNKKLDKSLEKDGFHVRSYFLLILLFGWSIALHAQIQKGQDIDGLGLRDNCGANLALSADGNTLAVSSHFNGFNGYDAGMVRIFNWNGTSWIQKGINLLGDSIDDAFGITLDLSNDGNVLAVGVPFSAVGRDPFTGATIGMVEIYEWNGNSWTQRGATIHGDTSQWQFGLSLSMDNSGDYVAVGSFGKNVPKSEVQVFRWNGTNWIQVGGTLRRGGNGGRFGVSVDLNGDGSTLMVGADFSVPLGGSGISWGSCSIFRYNGTVWNQLGNDIFGEAAGDVSGIALALNDSGDVAIIGAPGNDGNGNGSGHARVHRWDGTSWTQQGGDLDGEAALDLYGSSVSMNAKGDVIAIGARENSGNGPQSGHVRVFEWNGTSWIQQGIDIDGEAMFDESGTSVALDSLGYTVAIGAPENSNANGAFVGHARVFDIANVVGVKSLANEEGVVTGILPNPFDKSFILSFKTPVVSSIRVSNANGQLVQELSIQNKTQQEIVVEGESGVYFVEIVTDNNREVHKVVKL